MATPTNLSDIYTAQFAHYLVLEGENEMVTIEQGDEAMVVEVTPIILELADGNRFVLDSDDCGWVA